MTEYSQVPDEYYHEDCICKIKDTIGPTRYVVEQDDCPVEGHGTVDRPKFPSTPACTVCGEELTLAGTGPRGLTMVCPDVKYAGGSQEEKEHYEESRLTLPDVKSFEVYALRQEIRRLHGEVDWE